MALQQPLTTAELQELDDDDLFEYFTEYAGHFPTAPEGAEYAIRLGSRSLFSGDTRDLFEKFRNAVARAN